MRELTKTECQLVGRIGCVKMAVGQGYGEKHSLRNFVQCVVTPRIKELQPLAHEVTKKPSAAWICDEVKDLCEVHENLLLLRAVANKVIDDPSIPGVKL